MILILLSMLIGLNFQSTAQIDASLLLREVLKKSEEVKSFEADVDIDVDVDFIRIPVKKGRVFYKSPDRFRFRAKGFVLVPKKGLNFNMQEILASNHAAIYVGEDSANHKIKIVPMNDQASFLLATAFVDKSAPRINRLEVTTQGQGNYILLFEYGDLPFEIPAVTRIKFEINQIDIPMKFIGNLKVDKKKMGEKSSGTVTLRYSNFVFNKNIPDVVFEETDQSGL
jgi:outer membrane lipoprotein-sorting protein